MSLHLLSKLRARPAARAHGGAEAHRRRIRADFSVNVNPYGPSAAVVEALRRAPLHVYPDTTALAVRRAIAERAHVTPDEVVLGHGASELFWTFARTLLPPGTRALVQAPAFGEIVGALAVSGTTVSSLGSAAGDPFGLDVHALRRALDDDLVDAVFLSHPSTPAGRPLSMPKLREVAAAHPATCIVLDESFLALSERHADADEALPENVVRVRSMTKDHALPGVRVGYMLCPAAVAAVVEVARPAWSTSTLAQAAALAALDDEAFVAQSRERLLEDRAGVQRTLRRLDLAVVPSVAPYVIARVGDASALHHALLEQGILVRDCTSFGLPEHVRFAARPESERRLLEEALERVLTRR